MTGLASERREAAGRAAAAIRPRDAAALIVLDPSGGHVKVLMGRRAARHVFMPRKYVFPGGRTDRTDGRAPASDELHPDEEGRIGASPSRRRAIAVCALREAWEEAGLVVAGAQAGVPGWRNWAGAEGAGWAPSLAPLRLIARAVTPPGALRRFNTRFFAVWRRAVLIEAEPPSDELEDLVWPTLAEARKLDLPDITQIVLDDLDRRLSVDPELTPGGGVVRLHRQLHGRFVSEPVEPARPQSADP